MKQAFGWTFLVAFCLVVATGCTKGVSGPQATITSVEPPSQAFIGGPEPKGGRQSMPNIDQSKLPGPPKQN
jgi:hypothetical protein